MTDLVHVVDDVPDLIVDGRGPVLVHALDGFLDAGGAGRILGDQLAGLQPGRVIASFDLDALYDYRGRRPGLVFDADHYTDYEAPRLVVRLVSDAVGEQFLVLTGPEPDYQWERFARAVIGLVERFGVRLNVALGGVPMAVPHTRPLMVTTHAAQSELVAEPNVWKGRIQVPASAQGLLELRLGERGHPAMGFVAHVPHYLAQMDYPQAAISLTERLQRATGLDLRLPDLASAAHAREQEIAEQVGDSEEITSAVEALEQQYDAFARAQESSLLADDGPLPSAEELGAEFERFLAGIDRRDEQG
ncbi:MAG TPA: PAC2 family protein [Nocardioidaceae bacterium]|nr:PAC2 family protein [Nocardioidaceae bacterium]